MRCQTWYTHAYKCLQFYTKLYTQIRDEEDVSKLQRDLDRLQEWARNWQLKFNPDKCKVLLGRTNQQKSYYMYVDKHRSLLGATKHIIRKGPGGLDRPKSDILKPLRNTSGKGEQNPWPWSHQANIYLSGQNKPNKTVFLSSKM